MATAGGTENGWSGGGAIVPAVTGSTGLVEGRVSSHLENMQGKADQAYEAALGFASALGTFSPPEISIPIPDLTLSDIELPDPPTAAPGDSITDIAFPAIDDFLGNDPGYYTAGTAPTNSLSAPDFSPPARPGSFSVSAPTAPAISFGEAPDAPSYLDIEVPSLDLIVIPDAPNFETLTFTDVAPEFSIEVPDIGIIFSESPTADQFAALDGVLAGLVSAESAIWEKGQERLSRNIENSARRLFDDFAARGFTMPDGVILEAQMELRAKGTDTLADNARDAMIKEADYNLAKLSVLVQAGVQKIGILANQQSQIAQRALDAQKAQVDANLAIFTARVAAHNASIEVYKAKAQVFGDRIRGQLSQVEQYKALIDGLKAKGEVNKQLVDIYVAKHQALSAKAEVYRNQIAGYQAKAEVERTKIDAFRAEVQAYGAQVAAKGEEYRAYAEEVRGEIARVGVFEAQVKAYAAQVDAYSASEGAKLGAYQASIERTRAIAANYQAKVQGIAQMTNQALAALQSESAKYEAQAKAFVANASVYEAKGKMTIAKSEAQTRSMLNQAEVALRRASLYLDASLRASGLEMQSMEAAGRTVAQLAASAMSAVNVHASMSSSTSTSLGNSLSESYSGSVSEIQ